MFLKRQKKENIRKSNERKDSFWTNSNWKESQLSLRSNRIKNIDRLSVSDWWRSGGAVWPGPCGTVPVSARHWETSQAASGMRSDFYRPELENKCIFTTFTVWKQKNAAENAVGFYLAGSTWVFCPLLDSQSSQASHWMKLAYWEPVWLLGDFWKLLKHGVTLKQRLMHIFLYTHK